MSKPDYVKWMRKDYWTLSEAACLLLDQEPVADETEFMRCVKARKPAALSDTYGDLKNADIKKTLKAIDPGYGGWVGHRRVDPSHCVEWALKREMGVPDPFRSLAHVQKSTERTEATQLMIIGALLQVLLGARPNGKPNSVFQKQAAIIDAVRTMYPEQRGLGKRTLEEVFAKANRVLSSE